MTYDLLVISDLHGKTAMIDRLARTVAPPDMLIVCGDLTHFGDASAAAEIVAALGEICPAIQAVPGNCDPPGAAGYLEQQKICLHGRQVQHSGLCVTGVGYSLPCPAPTPGEMSEAAFSDHLATCCSDLPLILITHQPPYGTCADRLPHNQHVGSHALRRFIEQYQPLLCCCGHIHEGIGIDTIGNTTIVNPGPLQNGHYCRIAIADGRPDVTLARLE